MDFLLGLLFTLLFVSDSKLVHSVNTTIMDSALLLCRTSEKITDLRNLRFYWQDDRKKVLYSFNKGEEMPGHISDRYLKRVSAFPQDMITGNISVLLNNLTLEDNGRIFEAYTTVFTGSETTILQTTQVCQINLYVTVPYKDIRLAVHTDTMTSVCTVHGGFPAPEIYWTAHHNGSESLVDPRDVHTTTAQDPESLLYTSSSTLHIPAGPHQALTCLCHNPTLNATLNTTYTLSKGAAVWSLPGRSAGLTVAAALLLTALQQL
ncbi:T-lymphocyte activation antigen CD80-like [Archocentrus centrarchus]|uniref:T-lymphocyte activation antigen CD80-like n=1 Tax=Archocentrus centrarchus TaxID=63155 RepID=UPI0011EA4197|nr:T-lymphocyte activation antigen CD80-like [Archocentrus centrarchus]XP_030614719.1 T-lymphocyte activation antigen CD80-like [Archocentrus centrarchus]